MTIESLVKYIIKHLLIKGYYGNLTIYVEDGDIARIEKRESMKELAG